MENFAECVTLDFEIIVTGSTGHHCKFWDRNTPALIRTLKGHSNWVFGLAMDKESSISCSFDGITRIWLRANITKQLEGDAHDASVNSMVLNEQVIGTGSGGLGIDGQYFEKE